MDSKSPDSYISGVRILDTVIRRPDDDMLAAARILTLLRLQQFRRGVQSLSSLLETCLEEEDGGSGSTNTSDQKELLSHGLCIFGNLPLTRTTAEP